MTGFRVPEETGPDQVTASGAGPSGSAGSSTATGGPEVSVPDLAEGPTPGEVLAEAILHYAHWFGSDCRCDDNQCPIHDAVLLATAEVNR